MTVARWLHDGPIERTIGHLNPGAETALTRGSMAEEVGFEPTVSLHPQRFSRPSHSAALAFLRRPH